MLFRSWYAALALFYAVCLYGWAAWKSEKQPQQTDYKARLKRSFWEAKLRLSHDVEFDGWIKKEPDLAGILRLSYYSGEIAD